MIIHGQSPHNPPHSIVLLHALPANSSNSLTSTGPLTPSSANASTTASATTSTLNGFVTAAPNGEAEGFLTMP